MGQDGEVNFDNVSIDNKTKEQLKIIQRNLDIILEDEEDEFTTWLIKWEMEKILIARKLLYPLLFYFIYYLLIFVTVEYSKPNGYFFTIL